MRNYCQNYKTDTKKQERVISHEEKNGNDTGYGSSGTDGGNRMYGTGGGTSGAGLS